MTVLHPGQCGLCAHFQPQTPTNSPAVEAMRMDHEAAEWLVEGCQHPKNAELHLKVTPISGCNAFEPAR